MSVREQIWTAIVETLNETPDANARAVLVQNAIAQVGPVPNSMGEIVRQAMTKPIHNPDIAHLPTPLPEPPKPTTQLDCAKSDIAEFLKNAQGLEGVCDREIARIAENPGMMSAEEIVEALDEWNDIMGAVRKVIEVLKPDDNAGALSQL